MEQFFLNTLSLSLSGALVGAVLLAIHPFTKKWFSKRWNYYIWLLVVARLILPSQIQPPNALPVSVRVPEAALSGREEAESGEREKGADAFGGGTPGTENADDVSPAAESDSLAKSADGKTGAIGRSGSMADKGKAADWLVLPVILWLLGAGVSLFMKVRGYRRFVSCVHGKRESISDTRIDRLAEETAERLHMKRTPDIFVSGEVSGPITLGLLKPAIVLPKEFLAEFLSERGNLQQLSLVLRHEFIHVKQKDLWYKWLYQIMLCVHWFNPVLYLVGRMLNIDCELACDEAVVIGLTAEGKKAYGNVLINTAERYVDFRGNIPSTTLLERREDLKERLKGIIHYKKQKKLKLLVSGCLSLALLYLTACGSVQVYRGEERHSSETDAAKDLEREKDSSFMSKLSDFFENDVDDFIFSTGIVNKSGKSWKMYDDDSLLAGEDENDQWRAYSYAGGGYEITSKGFVLNGSCTILIAEAFDDTTVKVESSYNLIDGKFKTVCVKPDGSVEVIDDTGERGFYEVTLEKGRNVIKMVGQGAKLKELSIEFPDIRERDFAALYSSEREEYAAGILSEIRSGKNIDKEKVLESLSYMEDEEVSEVLDALLRQKERLTTGDICDLFIFSDSRLSTKYLTEAVARGDIEPDGEMVKSLMPYLSDTNRGSLIQVLKGDLYWETLCDCMPYLSDNERTDCILSYLENGNTITFTEYKEISPYLSDRTVKAIDKYLAEN